MSKILNYILISSFLLAFQFADAQELIVNDEIANDTERGLSFGFNIAPLIIVAFEPERKGIEFVSRYLFKKKWFAIGEMGFENVIFEKEPYDYKSNGLFVKLGADYNFFKVDEPGNNDNITLGLRYGLATQSHESPRFTIIDGYWGDYSGEFGMSNVTSHWFEIVSGIRTEVLHNFYMGWTLRLKSLLSAHSKNEFKPYTIPGYGHGDNSINVGFTYTFEYYLPFRKNK